MFTLIAVLKLQILLKSLNQVSSSGNNSGKRYLQLANVSGAAMEPDGCLYVNPAGLKSQECIKNKLSRSTENQPWNFCPRSVYAHIPKTFF